MGTVLVYTKDKIDDVFQNSIASADVVDGVLVLTKFNASTANVKLSPLILDEGFVPEIDDQKSMLQITPTGADVSGIVFKEPASVYGDRPTGHDPGSGLYATGQAFTILKNGTFVNPEDAVLFRINSLGGLGTGGAMHIATGLRQTELGAHARMIWMQPAVDITYAQIAMEAQNNQTGDFIRMVRPATFDGNFLRIEDSDGTDRIVLGAGVSRYLHFFDEDGNVMFSTSAHKTPSTGIRLGIRTGAATTTGLWIEGYTGQSNPLTVWTLSANATSGGIMNVSGDFALNFLSEDGSLAVARIAAKTSPTSSQRAWFKSGAVDVIPLTLFPVSGQTAALLRIPTHDGVERINIGADFSLNLLNTAGSAGVARIAAKDDPSNNWRAWFAAGAVGIIPLTLFPASGQTADILRIDNFAATTRLSRFDKNGTFITQRVAAPADADLVNNEIALWSDDNNVYFKKKTSAGVIKSWSGPLA